MNKYKSHALFILKLVLTFTFIYYFANFLLPTNIADTEDTSKPSVFDFSEKEKTQQLRTELQELTSSGIFKGVQKNTFSVFNEETESTTKYLITEETNLICIDRYIESNDEKIDMSEVFIDYGKMSDSDLNTFYGKTDLPTHQIIATLMFSNEEEFPIRVNFVNSTNEVKLIVIFLKDCVGIND